MQDFLSSNDINSQLRFVAGKLLQWTEPESIKDLVNEKYYTIRKESIKPVHKLVKFLKPAASKELFKLDPEVWRHLRDKKMKDPTTLTNWENAQFVVVDKEVITIVAEESDIATSQFLNSLSELDKNTYSVMYNYNDKRFEAVAYNKTKVENNVVDGIIIDLSIPKRDLKVWEVQINFDEYGRFSKLLPVPNTVVKGSLDSDLFEKIGGIERLIDSADATGLVKYILDDLDINLSVSEAFKYLKIAGLNIKGKDVPTELSALKFAVQNTHLSRFLEKLDEANLQYSQIKRMYPVAQTTTFTLTTFSDIFEMLTQINDHVEGTKVRLAKLPDLMAYVSSNKIHKKQLDQANNAMIQAD
ncbi:hypothetical protein SP15_086 [Bacillus phage SP-15]|uniref:Uncharacterized protein n=1 Tax=Bacillus phage SP-15 TaxID=1792032 RepID=A0A127AW75_9CAUD|nr:hypothetical protein SP15_086 [Bacillus phage SP-15]AMM44885.1 hypothetical protein SP15_086 [Bacillus phage SP-15]